MKEKSDSKSILKDWARGYLKHRDLYARSITGFRDTGEGFVVEYRDREAIFIICPQFSLPCINSSHPGDSTICVVGFNSMENIGFLLRNWEVFSKDRRFTFYLANPDSQKDKRWILSPYVHSRVADDSSLRRGLLGMAENVDMV